MSLLSYNTLLTFSITSLRTSTRTPISTVPGWWAMLCSAHSFSSQSAPAPSRRHDHFFRRNCAFARLILQDRARAHAVFDDHVHAFAPEQQVHAVIFQFFFDGKINFLRLFRAEVADGAVDEFQPRRDGALANLGDLVLFLHAFHVRIGAEFQIDPIGIVDERLRLRRAHEVGKIAAHFATQREFSVGKTRPRPKIPW